MLRLFVRSGLLFGLVLSGFLAASPAPVSASTATTPTATVTGTIAPNSASGCNQNVCIFVYGSGLHVDEIDSTAVLPRQMCTVWRIYANGSLIGRSNMVCGRAGATVFGFWHINRNFPNQTKLCVSWFGVPGLPCETVHQ